jgi:hypothetical protein
VRDQLSNTHVGKPHGVWTHFQAATSHDSEQTAGRRTGTPLRVVGVVHVILYTTSAILQDGTCGVQEVHAQQLGAERPRLVVRLRCTSTSPVVAP